MAERMHEISLIFKAVFLLVFLKSGDAAIVQGRV